MRDRWRKFLHPYGMQRAFDPRKWEWRDRILILGELVAFGAALSAIPVELSGSSIASWLVIGATLAATLALFWYAFDLISVGEAPLTNRSAHKIRQVVSAMEMEKEGAVFDWENIDERGGIPSDMSNWSRLRPELKAIMDKHGIPLLAAANLLAAEESKAESRQSSPDDPS